MSYKSNEKKGEKKNINWVKSAVIRFGSHYAFPWF